MSTVHDILIESNPPDSEETRSLAVADDDDDDMQYGAPVEKVSPIPSILFRSGLAHYQILYSPLSYLHL
jgi:hypothetical protein